MEVLPVILFGLAMVIAGIIISVVFFRRFMKERRSKKEWDKVEAKIVDIETYRCGDERKHRAYVSYEHRGNLCESVPLNFYSSSMRVGKTRIIYVNPVDSCDVATGNSLFFLFFAVIMGPVCICNGLFTIYCVIPGM